MNAPGAVHGPETWSDFKISFTWKCSLKTEPVSVSQFSGCILQRLHLKIDCVTAVRLDCPISETSSNVASKCCPSTPEKQRLQWVDPSQPNLSQDSLWWKDRRCNMLKRQGAFKLFSMYPTSALLLGNSSKGRTSWWSRSRTSSVEQTVSFQFGLCSPRGPWKTASSQECRLRIESQFFFYLWNISSVLIETYFTY